jgi:DNA-binding NtrC family response regulator
VSDVRKRILFVDDEPSIRLTLPRILAKHGFDVTSVASVQDALTEIQAEKFDALLSDLNMPLPHDGFGVITAMRQHQPQCINFILTGYPDPVTAAKATDHQVAHYFTKPLPIDGLVHVINQKLAAPQPPSGVPMGSTKAADIQGSP